MTEMEKLLMEQLRIMNESNQKLLEQNERQLAQNDRQNDKLEQLTLQNKNQAAQIENLTNLIANMNRQRFGSKSEQNQNQNQLSLLDDEESHPFNSAEQTADKAADTETITYQRKKQKGQREVLTRDLPVVEIEHLLSDDKQVCSCCESQMKRIGLKLARTELNFIPAHLEKHVHYEEAYECLDCKKNGQNTIHRSIAPQSALQKSLAGPSCLAHAIYQKLEMGLPFYRQEKEWLRYGLSVSRRTLTNWHNKATTEWLTPLYEAMKEELLQQKVLSADETVYQILNREDGKPATSDARIWLFRTSDKAEIPIILYHSSETRRFEVAENFLRGFEGTLHCDGYQVYQKLSDVKLQTCWAHVRRKFIETNDPYGQGAIGVAYCDKLFKLEREWKRHNLSGEELTEKRQTEATPLLDQFWSWIASLQLMKGPLKKAVDYTLKLKDSLSAFLENSELVISNNLAERSIRPITVGRKNWYFSASVEGARANAVGYSIIQTAKENGLEPFKYLTWLFEELPQLDIFQYPERIKAYMPWSPLAQSTCQRKRTIAG